MPYCPECRSLLYPRPEGGMSCRNGHVTAHVESKAITTEMRVKERVVLDDREIVTQPTMRTECPSCGHMEAYWLLRQTRRSDEPETTFFTCTKCKHRWRKY